VCLENFFFFQHFSALVDNDVNEQRQGIVEAIDTGLPIIYAINIFAAGQTVLRSRGAFYQGWRGLNFVHKIPPSPRFIYNMTNLYHSITFLSPKVTKLVKFEVSYKLRYKLQSFLTCHNQL
jgi:hypothetical protein